MGLSRNLVKLHSRANLRCCHFRKRSTGFTSSPFKRRKKRNACVHSTWRQMTHLCVRGIMLSLLQAHILVYKRKIISPSYESTVKILMSLILQVYPLTVSLQQFYSHGVNKLKCVQSLSCDHRFHFSPRATDINFCMHTVNEK